MTRAYDLMTGLLPRLQAIRTANGYATDAGASVLYGPAPKQAAEVYPFLRLLDAGGVPETPHPSRPRAITRVSFLVEAIYSPGTATQSMAAGHALVGDIQRALFGDAARDLDGAAIRTRPEGWQILPPEDGATIAVVQVRGSFAFDDDYTQP